jgi:esterase/lipase superfamily enzyme
MRRDITSWYSPRLNMQMPLVAYGHFGQPVLMLPTAAADFLEYERFHLINSVSSFLEEGKAKIYSINSVNRLALLNENASPWERIEWLKRYDGYITEEVLPLIREDCRDPHARPIVAGISLGAYLAGNTFFRHSDLFGGAILLSGSYDIRSYMGGFHNDDVYFNNPAEYLPRLNDDYHLPLLQDGGRRIIIFSGQGSFEAPERSRQLAGILNDKGIPHWLDIWGDDVNHDWPWWRDAMPYYFGKLFG